MIYKKAFYLHITYFKKFHKLFTKKGHIHSHKKYFTIVKVILKSKPLIAFQ